MKPRLLDVFSGAGGCARGYQRAGFYVVGVDHKPQPRYGGDEFHQADALEVLRALLAGESWQGYVLADFDAIHASPPCQAHSTIGKQSRQRDATLTHADHIEATRDYLVASSLPYVIENVPGAPLRAAVMLCGSSFGLNVRRHRLFESNVPIMAPPCAHYWQTPRFRSLDKRRVATSRSSRSTEAVRSLALTDGLASVVGVHGHHNYAGERALREWAMDIDWMSSYELTQAIPPAMTEHIGAYLMLEVQARQEQAA